MKESNQMIENRIKRALEASVPHILPKLLEDIETREEVKAMNQVEKRQGQAPLAEKKTNIFIRPLRVLAPVAAALILILGAWMAFANLRVQSVIAFDVNPSIELSVNQKEKVLRAQAGNEEALVVMGDMKLKGVDLDVAVNALIGSMVRQGYLSDMKNSILITVDSKDAQGGVRLQERLSREIDQLLDGFSVQGAIVSQTSKADDQLKELARTYGISTGKAALLERLTSLDPSLLYEDLATLPINDINLLIAGRKAQMEGVLVTGHASSKGYIGQDKAKAIAFQDAGVTEDQVSRLEVELDYEDGRMVYEVEFYLGQVEYDYDIDAKTGRIVKFETKDKGGSTPPAQGDYIGGKRAEDIALGHAGFSRNQVTKLETEFKDKKGKVYYEVEFKQGGFEYEYEIDAISGKILEMEIEEIKPGSPGQTGAEPTTKPGQQISSRQAEDLALAHAGLTRSQVTKLETEFKDERGKVYYEVEFEDAAYEYEYEIDAFSGKILEVEVDARKTGNQTQPTAKPGSTDKTYIGSRQAEDLALAHAGFSRSQVTKLETEFKDKKGKVYYEVEFKQGGYEYEYEIDAVSGKIIEFEKELD